MNRSWLAALAVVLTLWALGPPAYGAESKGPAKKAARTGPDAKQGETSGLPVLGKPAVFPMKEVSAFDKVEVEGVTRTRYPYGPTARCGPEPSKEVKAYPTLKSKRPLYGSITFQSNYFDPSQGKTFYFVLDESGEAQKPVEGEKAAEAKKPEKQVQKRKTPSGDVLTFVEPMGVPVTYDRLYFDVNGDRDLTNHGVLKLAKETPPEGRSVRPGARVFEDLLVPFDYGPPLGERPFAMVPRIRAYGRDAVMMDFVPKTIRVGKIRLGDEQYVAILSQSRMISGRYDSPFVELEVIPIGDTKGPRLLKSGLLGEVRSVGNQLLASSATPLGDKLTVGPYQGPTGVLEVGPGGRAITELGLAGGLMSRTALVTLGDLRASPTQPLTRRYTLPVGDYLPAMLMVQYGRLRFSARVIDSSLRSTSTDGRPAKPPQYSVKIRKDKPFLLEFSGKPAVEFSMPRQGQSFQPGDTVAIRAMLTEPLQGILITGLTDTTKKPSEAKPEEKTTRPGAAQTGQLHPSIVIRDSKGETVAEGKMPFG